jgi:rSAM/selenodomain-associated transferase 2/rSAM/selenodomain-associated transferase 1
MTMTGRKRLILFTRFPVAGKVKTRLIPALGSEGAAGLHRRLVLRTLRTAREACEKADAGLEVRFEGGSEEAMRHWLGDGLCFKKQGEGDLGERMANAFEASFREGSQGTLIIGSDCPQLTPGIILAGFNGLSKSDVVFGPAKDGGYYLIGLNAPIAELFAGIPWSTERVLAESMRVLEKRKMTVALLEPLEDVDRPEDLAAWEKVGQGENDFSRISVIIPTLNEESRIVEALREILKGNPHQVIVADGGSRDRTVELAKQTGVQVVVAQGRRGSQMNAGAAWADGDVLLFLHVDTVPPPGWARLVCEALRRPGVAAGAFRFEIEGDFRLKRMIEWGAGVRSRWLQLPYGDQGIFCARALFESIGGFAELPIMEDYEMVRRLRRFGRIETLAASARTSGRRWEKTGVLRTTLINQIVLIGYHIGVSPGRLARFYRGTTRKK